MTWQPTQLEQQRLEKLERLKEAGIEPYPLRVERTHTTVEAIAAFESSNDESIAVTVCGRLVSVRDMGKTVFAHVIDEFGRIQLFLRRDDIGEDIPRYLPEAARFRRFCASSGYALSDTNGGD